MGITASGGGIRKTDGLLSLSGPRSGGRLCLFLDFFYGSPETRPSVPNQAKARSQVQSFLL